MPGPLEGYRILDLTTVGMGPYAAQTLGDLGADVIKIESPEGDMLRTAAPGRSPGMSPLFLQTNRSKRSLVLDLKQAAGRAVLLRLAAKADVLLTNIRPDAMARLGLDYDQVAAVSPAIVYVSLVGYAQNGPYAPRPAFDDLIIGASGLAALEAELGGGPRYPPAWIADLTVGLFGLAVGPVIASSRTMMARISPREIAHVHNGQDAMVRLTGCCACTPAATENAATAAQVLASLLKSGFISALSCG